MFRLLYLPVAYKLVMRWADSQGLQVDRYASLRRARKFALVCRSQTPNWMQAPQCAKELFGRPAIQSLIVDRDQLQAGRCSQISQCHRCRNPARLQSCGTGRGQS